MSRRSSTTLPTRPRCRPCTRGPTPRPRPGHRQDEVTRRTNGKDLPLLAVHPGTPSPFLPYLNPSPQPLHLLPGRLCGLCMTVALGTVSLSGPSERRPPVLQGASNAASRVWPGIPTDTLAPLHQHHVGSGSRLPPRRRTTSESWEVFILPVATVGVLVASEIVH